MLHPVGNLPAAVYWRRRALVSALLLSVLGGGGWVGYAALTGQVLSPPTAVTAASAPLTAVATPSLERVTPAVATVAMPAPYGPCPDDALEVRVSAPPTVAAGAGATFDLVVTNVSAVPCVRALDRGLQEVTVFDAAGRRIWSSNDCRPATAADPRTLQPRQAVSLPVAWTGQTSAAGCTAQPVAAAAGSYVLRGRLDTVAAPDVALTVS